MDVANALCLFLGGVSCVCAGVPVANRPSMPSTMQRTTATRTTGPPDGRGGRAGIRPQQSAILPCLPCEQERGRVPVPDPGLHPPVTHQLDGILPWTGTLLGGVWIRGGVCVSAHCELGRESVASWSACTISRVGS